MKKFNQQSLGIITLSKNQMKTINGGVKWWGVALFGIGGSLFLEAVSGAYEAGIDGSSDEINQVDHQSYR